ncbi:MAG: phosphoribosylformylglycinamidine cyclo-ligase [Acidimicrobiia bacterium]|nr:phosphoribosylformylglycinamidine cyclo-ligase [Acidimicrobiia bacterium]
MGETYRSAGVDIDAGEEAVRRIKEKVRSTFRPEVIGDIGGFGGLFAFDPSRYRDPVLVSSTDGVGTKALVAQAAGRFDSIGVDLVAMCVDDIVCQGAEPLFFLDYIAVGRLDPDHIEQLVHGVAEGCRQAGCALIGGEMAEHPGAMEPGEFDLVGFAVGVVERDRLITGEHVSAGDVLVGLPSPGLRSNGYSLARRVLLDRAGRSLDDPAFEGAHESLGDELLRPSVIYAPAIGDLLRAVDVRAVAHVTGGGLAGNLARVLPDDVDAEVDASTWERPRIFGEVQRLGEIADEEMARVFNLGIGMVVVVPAEDAFKALDVARTAGHRAAEIGVLVDGDGTVRIA